MDLVYLLSVLLTVSRKFQILFPNKVLPCLTQIVNFLFMNNYGDLLVNSFLGKNVVQIVAIISLNIYYKEKCLINPSNSKTDRIFNYCVLAFTGTILIGITKRF